MKNLFLIPLIIVLISSLVLSSCTKTETIATTPTLTTPSQSSPAALTPKYGGVLKIVCDPIPANIGWPSDPMSMIQGVVQNCLETLLRGDNKGGVIPWLAESYKIADDLKSMTFVLRKGVKFHDGSDFNAEVAKWNLDNYIS